MFRPGISSLHFIIFFFFNQHYFLLAIQIMVYVKIFEQFVILAIKISLGSSRRGYEYI